MPKINTYTDNSTIEDADALLTYDPSNGGATKLTTFARIASWMSAKLAALAKKTAITSADQILMVNGSATARIDYNVLAKAILEEYSASTLAGSAQSVQSALNTIKTATIPSRLASGTDLNTVTTKGHYYNDLASATFTNCPVSGIGFTLDVLSKGGTKNQTLIATNGKMYYRTQMASAWAAWKTISNLISVISKNDFLEKMTDLDINEAAVFYGYGTFGSDMTGGAIGVVLRGIVSRTTAGTYDFILEAYNHRLFTGRYVVEGDVFTYEEFAKQDTYYFSNTTGTHEWTLNAGSLYLIAIYRVGANNRTPGLYMATAHGNSGASQLITVVEPTGFTPTINLDKFSLTIDTGTETYVKVAMIKIS